MMSRRSRYIMTKNRGPLSSMHTDAIGGAHCGQNATINKVTQRFRWENVASDVRNLRNCVSEVQSGQQTGLVVVQLGRSPPEPRSYTCDLGSALHLGAPLHPNRALSGT